jgi:hypothetical protein
VTAIDVRPVRRAALPSPLAWTGRALTVVAGAFAAADGITRLTVDHSMVPGAASLDRLEPFVGGALLAGALLVATRRLRLPGAATLALALTALAIAEGRAATPSADHLLFWLYVAAMSVAGGVLRRSSQPKT